MTFVLFMRLFVICIYRCMHAIIINIQKGHEFERELRRILMERGRKMNKVLHFC